MRFITIDLQATPLSPAEKLTLQNILARQPKPQTSPKLKEGPDQKKEEPSPRPSSPRRRAELFPSSLRANLKHKQIGQPWRMSGGRQYPR
jgi:hypothetical protein